MVNAAKPICFVATRQSAAARQFYEGTLELKLTSDDPFALVFDLNGTMLRVQKVQQHAPAQHTVLGWEVKDIQAAVKQLATKGARFEHFAGLGQDASGIWTSPSGARVAWFKDPDGNTLSLTQFQPAKAPATTSL